MDLDTANLAISDNQPVNRYETTVGDPYRPCSNTSAQGDSITFTHTRVPEPIEGHGVAARLARGGARPGARG